jgi:ribonuclease P protein component
MLAREHRLRKAYEITRVYKKGAYGSAGGVVSVKAAPSGRPVSRVVVVVGKKISKRAVVRNRIRRRLVGLLREEWATVRSGYDIVITVHSDASELPADTLRRHLTEALRRASVITT